MPAPVVTDTGTAAFVAPGTPSATERTWTAANCAGTGGIRVAICTYTIGPYSGGSNAMTVSAGWTLVGYYSPSSAGGIAFVTTAVVVAVQVGGTDDCVFTLTRPNGYYTNEKGITRMWRVGYASEGGGYSANPLGVATGYPVLGIAVASVKTSGGGGSNNPPMVETAANGWTLVESVYNGGTVSLNQGHARHVWFRDIAADGSYTLPTYNSGDFSFNSGYQARRACYVGTPVTTTRGWVVGTVGISPASGWY